MRFALKQNKVVRFCQIKNAIYVYVVFKTIDKKRSHKEATHFVRFNDVVQPMETKDI